MNPQTLVSHTEPDGPVEGHRAGKVGERTKRAGFQLVTMATEHLEGVVHLLGCLIDEHL